MAMPDLTDPQFDDPEARRQALLAQMSDAPIDAGRGATMGLLPNEAKDNPLAGVPDTGAGARGTLPAVDAPGTPPLVPIASPAGTPPVNQNPLFDPSTNITPGQDIPLKGKTAGAATTPPADPNDVGSMIDSLYQKANIKDGGAGSGFADRAYWLAHPSEVLNGRLGNDLAGTGTDQPTGTPGTGPWQNSGAADRTAGGPGGQPGPPPPDGSTFAPSTPQPFGLTNTGLDMNSIMAELQALITGQKSPSSRSAILSQLNG